MRTHLEVSISFEKSEEANLRLLMDTFQNEVISHVLVTIENIWCGLSNQNNIDKFLRGIAMLCEKWIIFHVHIV